MPSEPDSNAITLPPRARLPIAWIVGAWTLWGIWSVQQRAILAMVSGESAPARVNPWQLTMVTAGFLALATIVLMWTARLIRDRFASRVGRVIAHLGTFAVLHVADVATYWLASDLIASNPRPFLPMLFSLAAFNALTYTAVVFIITALDSAQALRARTARTSQLETQLALAQFHALRAQLHPHFLFNSLNAISTLIHSDPARADRMLARISELLRIAVDTAAQPEVPVHEELEFARRYLEIERMRYGDRLDVRIDVASGAWDALVPNMLLQPLLENAVRHGVAPHARPGCVEVCVSRNTDGLSIVVRDTGAGFDPDDAPGVGLSTTRQRLETLYGTSQRLAFATVPGGFETRVLLPLRWREPVAAS